MHIVYLSSLNQYFKGDTIDMVAVLRELTMPDSGGGGCEMVSSRNADGTYVRTSLICNLFTC